MKQITLKKISTAFFVFICVLAFSAGSASYGHISSTGKMMKTETLQKMSAACQSHLEQNTVIRQEVTDNPRGTSKALAVGILFGAKYALGPVQKDGIQGNGVQKVNKAQAITNYRTCLKERALKS